MHQDEAIEIYGIFNEEGGLGISETHMPYSNPKVRRKLQVIYLTNFCKWMADQSLGDVLLHIARTDRSSWRAMITQNRNRSISTGIVLFYVDKTNNSFFRHRLQD